MYYVCSYDVRGQEPCFLIWGLYAWNEWGVDVCVCACGRGKVGVEVGKVVVVVVVVDLIWY